MTKPQISRDPLDHHEAFVDVNCSCQYCQEWRQAKTDMDEIAARIAKVSCDCRACQSFVPHASWSHAHVCTCDLCREARTVNQRLLAAQNRHDLWCEMSYHATHDPLVERYRLAEEMMLWLKWEMGRRPDTRWWAVMAARASMGDWIAKFDEAIMAVSGISILPVAET